MATKKSAVSKKARGTIAKNVSMEAKLVRQWDRFSKAQAGKQRQLLEAAIVMFMEAPPLLRNLATERNVSALRYALERAEFAWNVERFVGQQPQSLQRMLPAISDFFDADPSPDKPGSVAVRQNPKS